LQGHSYEERKGLRENMVGRENSPGLVRSRVSGNNIGEAHSTDDNGGAVNNGGNNDAVNNPDGDGDVWGSSGVWDDNAYDHRRYVVV
jgi:hypothetical protein